MGLCPKHRAANHRRAVKEADMIKVLRGVEINSLNIISINPPGHIKIEKKKLMLEIFKEFFCF
jgi:hypothetical protein